MRRNQAGNLQVLWRSKVLEMVHEPESWWYTTDKLPIVLLGMVKPANGELLAQTRERESTEANALTEDAQYRQRLFCERC